MAGPSTSRSRKGENSYLTYAPEADSKSQGWVYFTERLGFKHKGSKEDKTVHNARDNLYRQATRVWDPKPVKVKPVNGAKVEDDPSLPGRERFLKLHGERYWGRVGEYKDILAEPDADKGFSYPRDAERKDSIFNQRLDEALADGKRTWEKREADKKGKAHDEKKKKKTDEDDEDEEEEDDGDDGEDGDGGEPSEATTSNRNKRQRANDDDDNDDQPAEKKRSARMASRAATHAGASAAGNKGATKKASGKVAYKTATKAGPSKTSQKNARGANLAGASDPGPIEIPDDSSSCDDDRSEYDDADDSDDGLGPEVKNYDIMQNLRAIYANTLVRVNSTKRLDLPKVRFHLNTVCQYGQEGEWLLPGLIHELEKTYTILEPPPNDPNTRGEISDHVEALSVTIRAHHDPKDTDTFCVRPNRVSGDWPWVLGHLTHLYKYKPALRDAGFTLDITVHIKGYSLIQRCWEHAPPTPQPYFTQF